MESAPKRLQERRHKKRGARGGRIYGTCVISTTLRTLKFIEYACIHCARGQSLAMCDMVLRQCSQSHSPMEGILDVLNRKRGRGVEEDGKDKEQVFLALL